MRLIALFPKVPTPYIRFCTMRLVCLRVNKLRSGPLFFTQTQLCKFFVAILEVTYCKEMTDWQNCRASPRTLGEARTQFRALCRSLNIDPDGEDVLSTLRNRSKLQWRAVTDAIESGDLGIENSTFRGSLDNSWAATSPDPMTWQHTGELARALSEKGVRSIVLGEVVDEWFIYSTVHQVFDADDIEHNLRRYYPADVVRNLMTLYPPLPDDAPRVDVQRLFGKILSDGQVHLPVRLLARDLIAADFPVVRYEIRWAPQQERPLGN